LISCTSRHFSEGSLALPWPRSVIVVVIVIVLVVVTSPLTPSGGGKAPALGLPAHLLPRAFGLFFVTAAVALLAGLELLDSLFQMLRPDLSRCVLVAAVAGVGGEVAFGGVTASTVIRVMAIEAEVGLVIEGRRCPGCGLVAGLAARLHTGVNHVPRFLLLVTTGARLQSGGHQQPVLEGFEDSVGSRPRVIRMTDCAGALPQVLVEGNALASRERGTGHGTTADLREGVACDAAGGLHTAKGCVTAKAGRVDVGMPIE